MISPARGTIWPPGETGGPGISSDELVDFLLDEKTRPGEAIRSVTCAGGVYGPLLKHLKGLKGVSLATFNYDWRKELTDTARELAALLDDAPAGEDIVLVAHSMGGLIARWMLESGTFDDRPWFGNIKHFVAAAVPHLGAPLALLRLLGKSGLNCVILPASSMKRLGSQPDRYPSGYQLLPAPGFDCYEHGPGTVPDLYTAATQKLIALDARGLAEARKLHGSLDRFAVPKGVTYHVLYGRGFQTVVGVGIDGGGAVTPTIASSGDGTVPEASANPSGLADANHVALYADHMGFLCHPGAIDYIDGVLGVSRPRALARRSAQVQVVPAWRSVPRGATLPVVLSVHPGTSAVEGTLDLVEQGTGETVASVPVASGTAVDHLSLQLRMPRAAGAYRLTFTGALEASGPAVLSVVGADADRKRPHAERMEDKAVPAEPSDTRQEPFAGDADAGLPAFSDAYLAGGTEAGTGTRAAPTPTGSAPRGLFSDKLTPEDRKALRPHLINLVQGRFTENSRTATSRDDVDLIFSRHLVEALEEAKARGDKLRILFYAHGGLVSEEDALVIARDQAEWWKKNHVYPLFFIWRTGMLETIGQLLSRLFTWKDHAGARGFARGFIDDLSDPAIEDLAHSLEGPTVWAGMKRSAERASDDPDGAAFYVAQLLKDFCDAHPDEAEVHGIGHSAGSIFHAHFVSACRKIGGPPFRTLSFLAPAIRVDTFKERLTYEPGTPQPGTPGSPKRALLDNIGHLGIFTMHKDLELADTCTPLYRKSLLYLIHHALEEEEKAPILGLEVSLRADRELAGLFGLGQPGGDRTDRTDIVWSSTDGVWSGRAASHSSTHGGFDNDGPTMNSVLRRVLGVDDDSAITEFPRKAQERAFRVLQRTGRPEELRLALRSPVAGPLIPSVPAFVAAAPPVNGWAGSGRRRALCVGIDRYADAPLYGCVADARAWADTLQRLGFEAPVMLLDEQATAHNILWTLQDLLTSSQPGDTVAFQYSGHGTQLPDLNGDEAGGDSPGQDEALCPIDYPSGAFVIDDDIGAVLSRMPDGVSVTCFIDCCHSGTISRFGVGPGLSGLAGGSRRARYIPATAAMVAAHRRFRAGSFASVPIGTPRGRDTMREVLFAACLSTEVAYENNGQGDFTRLATGILRQAQPDLTNEVFLQQVTQAFGAMPRQHPGLYCAPQSRGRPLFGGAAMAAGRSFGHSAAGGYDAPNGVGDQLRRIADLIDALGR